MNRRSFIQTTATAGVGALALTQISCGKSIGNEIAIIISTAGELKPLLPNQSALLDKISLVASDFNKSYSAGDFNSATNFFNSLADNVSTLSHDIGADNPHIAFLVAIISIGVHAVAALLSSQSTPTTLTKAASIAGAQSVNRAQQMASQASAKAVLNAVKF